jgi:methionyl-tRNA formyltransferase
LCGYGPLGLALLEALLQCADTCDIAGVFRWAARPGSTTGWEASERRMAECVAASGLRDIRCPGVNSYEFSALLGEIRPDVLLIGSWGEIVRPHVLAFPGLLPVNCHPSKLPAHRGANPYASVILAGETETGVTFHRIIRAVDAGPILLQRTLPLGDDDTGETVRDRCAALAAAMLPELVARLHAHIVDGLPLEEYPQDESKQSLYPSLRPEDGLLDWSVDVDALSRKLRGLYPWMAPASRLEGKILTLFRHPSLTEDTAFEGGDGANRQPGEIVRNKGRRIWIATTKPGTLLEIPACRIAALGGLPMPNWMSHLLSPWLLRPGRRFHP